MMGTRHFKNKGAYQKWVAFGHIHKVFENTPGNQKVVIGGRTHRVKHK